MGKKKNKNGNKAQKSAIKSEKKLVARQKKILSKLKEVDVAEVVAKLEAEESHLTAVNEAVCPPPSPRSGFTFISHPTKEQIVLFGGEFYNGQNIRLYNDLFFYNIGKCEWKQLRSPAGPAARSGHQMVAVSTDGGQLWLFGGEYASPSQGQFYHYKDLWVLRMNTKKWEKIDAPNGPSARSGHRMITLRKKLIIFGGYYDNNHAYKYYNDLHIFSLETYTWIKFDLNCSIIPPPRSGCCMAACPDGKILIWGGYSKSQVKKDVDRGVVHTDMFALVPDITKPNEKFKWISLKPGGFKLPPRSSMGCTLAPNGKAYCFGGVMDVDEDEENIEGQFCNDLLALDLSTQRWRLYDTSKNSKNTKNVECEETHSGHDIKGTAASNEGLVTDSDAILSTGSTSPMESSSINNCVPSPRMNPGMCVCKNNLYIYGGLFEEDTKQITLNDFYAFDLHKLEWRVLIPNNMDAHDWVDSESCSESSEDMESSEDDSEMDTD